MTNTVTISDFLGFRYDEDKLNQYEEEIEERAEQAEEAIPSMEYADELEARYGRNYSVCNCCGRLLVHSYFGYGVKCFEILLKSLDVVAKISEEFGKAYSEYTLEKWALYSKAIKDLYIRVNTNDNGELKKFRNAFKKSFVQSVIDNKENRFSRKQIDVMINDIENQAFYDFDKELLMILYEIKISIDYMHSYSRQNFMDDVNRYIIRNFNLTRKIRHFVDDNYMMKLSSNNNKTPNLQFNNSHAKVLYEISLLTNIYIPLATHYMYIHFIKGSKDVQEFMLALFDLCMTKYEEERGIYIYDKLYETATSVVNKSVGVDRILWQKNLIRGHNPTTHIRESIVDIIMQILPKYTYDRNIINFNYFSNRQCLRYKVTDISYEMQFSKLSASKRDSDQNSEFDQITVA